LVAYHRALDRRKYLLRRSFYDKSKGDLLPERQTSHGTDNPEFLYWESYVRDALDDLSEQQRATLQLHFFEGFTINEIVKDWDNHLQTPATTFIAV
jgi:RNA polymerase sigma-70 factor, ECF subfamily